jgi:hypothetical protein
MKLATPNLISTLTPVREGIVLRDDSLRYLVLDHQYQMVPIVRTGDELFTDTIKREGKPMKVVVNGSFYDLTPLGFVDSQVLSHMPADETILQGQVVRAGKVVAGISRPKHFYIAQKTAQGSPGWSYYTGFGDPPATPEILSAVGGAGPLIVGGLVFGMGNEYRPGTPPGPPSGDPGVSRLPDLTQRSNNTFASADKRPPSTGKTFIASSSLFRRLIIGVQQHGLLPGQTHDYIAQNLLRNGFESAVFFDGSDSATLMVDGAMVVMPAQRKDETNTLGIGFARGGV